MFTITLTRQQLYELYYEGPEATIHLIEGLTIWAELIGKQVNTGRPSPTSNNR